MALAVIWTILGLFAGVAITQAAVTDTLLSFFIPSLAAYQLALEIGHGQQRVAAERERLTTIVTTELRDARPGPSRTPNGTGSAR